MSGNPPDDDPSRRGYPDPNRPYPPWNGQDEQGHPPPGYPYPPSSYPPPEHDRAYYPPPPSQYPPPPHYPPGSSQYPPPSSMTAVHPHGAPPYMGYRPDPYGQPQAPQVVYQAAAPRQRTAIACRYCRRRKIRCSGFENSTDGRCTNCQRFNQQCMFTPVSSQAQAFVPAHAAYPHLRDSQGRTRTDPNVQLYGPHGQPLPPQAHDAQTTLPPPQGMYPPFGAPPPPLAGGMPDPRQRRGSGSGYDYPDPMNLAPVTPSSATPGYQTHTVPSPYYPQPHDRRTSPQGGYPYDARHSASPHNSPFVPLAPPSQGGVTPPPAPTSTPGGSQRGGLNVRDMLNPGDTRDSGARSSTDNDMLDALNRRGLDKK
ncbi:uncharacterized protein N7498_004561 [Penicillium cinerascens]|uniref:Zn(2)-C6 fungal-type domain-containing protein n=1 Tax=Penicillium cinerascens TaxID=70096 RepID=A0A9W9MLW1_9EURO|nr:uncharacterized protein N7498_004561 [Penicillium cinerascens]KAJ5203682.1 hypothetical protein N7498_004561 [Penicillium cinerascens]